jgi:hypothetical protein
MSEYAGKQFVGIDLHRRRSVMVRTDDAGEVLEAVRILDDVDRLNAVLSRAGECPEVVLEATYGWSWAVDALQGAGARVHLAHPLGVKAFDYQSGEERRPRCHRSGGSVADGSATGGMERAAGHPGVARAGQAPSQAGRPAVTVHGRGL